jgi:hypothetical protein
MFFFFFFATVRITFFYHIFFYLPAVLSQRLGLGKGGLRMAPDEALPEIIHVSFYTR